LPAGKLSRILGCKGRGPLRLPETADLPAVVDGD
jgi:hypothetical protein